MHSGGPTVLFFFFSVGRVLLIFCLLSPFQLLSMFDSCIVLPFSQLPKWLVSLDGSSQFTILALFPRYLQSFFAYQKRKPFLFPFPTPLREKCEL